MQPEPPSCLSTAGCRCACQPPDPTTNPRPTDPAASYGEQSRGARPQRTQAAARAAPAAGASRLELAAGRVPAAHGRVQRLDAGVAGAVHAGPAGDLAAGPEPVEVLGVLEAHLALERAVAPELPEEAADARVEVVRDVRRVAVAQAHARLARAHAELHVLRARQPRWVAPLGFGSRATLRRRSSGLRPPCVRARRTPRPARAAALGRVTGFGHAPGLGAVQGRARQAPSARRLRSALQHALLKSASVTKRTAALDPANRALATHCCGPRLRCPNCRPHALPMRPGTFSAGAAQHKRAACACYRAKLGPKLESRLPEVRRDPWRPTPR